jgi:hypothetical protein
MASMVERSVSGRAALRDASDIASRALTRRRRHAADLILRDLAPSPSQARTMRTVAGAKVSCVQANRRAGKTRCIGALLEMRALARDNYVVRVLTQRLAAPSHNWLDCDEAGKESFLKRLVRLGLWDEARVVRASGAIKSIRFPWGSAIHVHHVATQAAIDDSHGFSADFYWADEAQNLDLLPLVISQLITPTLADTDGQMCLSGTPGRRVGTAFHRYASGDAPETTVVACYSWENPFFGAEPGTDGTDVDITDQRWQLIVDRSIARLMTRYSLVPDDLDRLRTLSEDQRLQIARNAYTDKALQEWADRLDPDLLRQFFGRWIAAAEEYVYDWHDLADDFYFAKAADSPYPGDLPIVDSIASRVDLLPKAQNGDRWVMRKWYSVIGLDWGWSAPSAWVVLCWTEGIDVAYALYSAAVTKLHDEAVRDRTVALINELRAAGLVVQGVVADVNGFREGTRAQWDYDFSMRFDLGNIPVMRAAKADKDLQIKTCSMDNRAGRMAVVKGGPLDIEGQNLRILPNSNPPKIHKDRIVVLPNGHVVAPGDHCLDALRYARAHVPFLAKPAELKEDPFTEADHVAYIKEQVRLNSGLG